MNKNQTLTQKTGTKKVLRYAHPFFTTTPINQRESVAGVGNRMTDYIKTQLEPIPKPVGDSIMLLADIIGDAGAEEIKNFGAIRFHAAGDSGMESGDSEEMVVDVMAKDYDLTKQPAELPAFFFHLGDVNYYNNTAEGYQAQFYVPYKPYPGKIIAIPGNHDGELFKYNGKSTGQKTTLEAFMSNFCQSKTGVPQEAAGSVYREMVSQPGVYWYLNAPFVDIVGLYSNVAENPGYISGPTIGTSQKDWLTKTLTAINASRIPGEKRKALIIASHHPPLSSGHHSGSTEMLDDIDDSCTQAGIMPDAFFSAHAHNLQCYTRYLSFGGKDIQIPFIVDGGAGRTIQPVPAADGLKVKDNTKIVSYHTFDKSSYSYGYMDITVTVDHLSIKITAIDKTGGLSVFNTINVKIN